MKKEITLPVFEDEKVVFLGCSSELCNKVLVEVIQDVDRRLEHTYVRADAIRKLQPPDSFNLSQHAS